MTLAEAQHILGLSNLAGPGEERAAYFRLAKRYHPDTASGPAVDGFHRLAAAHQLLKDHFRDPRCRTCPFAATCPAAAPLRSVARSRFDPPTPPAVRDARCPYARRSDGNIAATIALAVLGLAACLIPLVGLPLALVGFAVGLRQMAFSARARAFAEVAFALAGLPIAALAVVALLQSGAI